MRKTMLIAMMAVLTLSNFACANGRNDNKAEAPSENSVDAKGDVVQMNNQLFISKVADYNSTKEWKYKGDLPTIIDFYADWCGPCRKVAPIMKELAKEYEGKIVIYKVDVDKEKELAAAMGIQSLPTIVFIPMNGDPKTIVGAADKATFKKAIDEYLLDIKAK